MKQEHPDWLESALRDPSPIDDRGFTGKVLAALPPRRRDAGLRPAILLGATVLSGGIGLFVLPGGAYLDQVTLQVLQRGPLTPALPFSLLLVTLLFAALGLACSE